MRIPLPGLFGSEVERVFLVVVLYEMASLIAEGHELGKAAPVVYVSSEKLIRYLVSSLLLQPKGHFWHSVT
ncbi:hypothetical protein CerSpe_170390 [Prunus speciosa]